MSKAFHPVSVDDVHKHAWEITPLGLPKQAHGGAIDPGAAVFPVFRWFI